MNAVPHGAWPWLAIAGLGVFHGANPAMGWLFAVALGLQRRSRTSVLLSWLPLTLGHAGGVIITLSAILALGQALDHATLRGVAALTLLGWALWHSVRGHRLNLRIGMQTSLVGLGLWSLLMSTAHGAGLMLVPMLLPVCLPLPFGGPTASGSVAIAMAALGIHTAAMFSVMMVLSVVVYEWIGLAILKSAWINFDMIWIGALILCGGLLMLG